MQDADEGEVKKAYKRAALKYHPDKWANATDVGFPLLLLAPASLWLA
jgi:curved DNA-binding protein CbpA